MHLLRQPSSRKSRRRLRESTTPTSGKHNANFGKAHDVDLAFKDDETSKDDGGRVAARPKNAKEKMADVAQTLALRQDAFGLSGWQSLPSLSLEHGLSLGLTYTGPHPPAYSVLFHNLSLEQKLTLELL
ncbi:hypothetical protein DVH24_004702 [Malus domestica]|uniref:Uncharacterized protein n=1 Tax=Malus domestica TaxID=3750 RepID=A0A498IAK9_MALDO|nr:hypothetical protein DVH24_004702 [Malus domestica]